MSNDYNYLNHAHALVETVKGTTPFNIEDLMMEDRKLWLTCPINPVTMNELLKQLMYLEQKDPEKEITLFINSSGGPNQ